MIRYGFIVMQRLTALPSAEAFRQTLAILRNYGYEGVELNLTEPLGLDLAVLERWVREFGLRIPSFLTGEAYFDGLCLSSPDEDVRRATVARVIGYLDVAERFNSILVVGLLQGQRRDEPDPDVANSRIRDGLRKVADVAGKRGVELVIEPVNHLQIGFNNSVAEVRALIDAVNSRSFRPMVDTIHMNIEESSIVKPILDCGPALRHVHLCESNGGAFGTGRVDFLGVLAALREINYDGFASVKVYRHQPPDAAARGSIEFLRGLEKKLDHPEGADECCGIFAAKQRL